MRKVLIQENPHGIFICQRVRGDFTLLGIYDIRSRPAKPADVSRVAYPRECSDETTARQAGFVVAIVFLEGEGETVRDDDELSLFVRHFAVTAFNCDNMRMLLSAFKSL